MDGQSIALPMPSVGRRALFIVLLLTAAMADLGAQRVRGRVLDDSTRLPIIGVEVIAIELRDGVVSDTARTDSSGAFVVVVPRPGRYVIRTRRLGYEPSVTKAVTAHRDEMVEVQVLMDLAPSTLARVVVIGRRSIIVSTLLDGFERRRAMGLGTFFTSEDIQARRPSTVIDLLHSVPGLRISPVGTRERLSATRGSLDVRSDGQCMPIFWVDGVRLNRSGSGQHILQWLPRGGELQAVEVYHGRAQYPAEFGGPEARCGVVVVWTRTPQRNGDSLPRTGEDTTRAH